MVLRDARIPGEIPLVQALFREYEASLGISLCFQGFQAEVAGLSGAYAAPAGCLLLAWADSALAGCVAVRPLEPGICELKRLYVRTAYRGAGLGRALTIGAIDRAIALGYGIMRLDTLAAMVEAQGLYRSLGFRETAPYNDHAVPGTLFMERDLA
jgi:ribosomal protein S18 acetylase RimI-like enzyme